MIKFIEVRFMRNSMQRAIVALQSYLIGITSTDQAAIQNPPTFPLQCSQAAWGNSALQLQARHFDAAPAPEVFYGRPLTRTQYDDGQWGHRPGLEYGGGDVD